jgi:hypothetical protein
LLLPVDVPIELFLPSIPCRRKIARTYFAPPRSTHAAVNMLDILRLPSYARKLLPACHKWPCRRAVADTSRGAP